MSKANTDVSTVEFHAEVAGWIPADARVIEFRPSCDSRRNPSMQYVRFTPAARPVWYGAFVRSAGRNGLDGLFAMASPVNCCVVAQGLAYIVDVESPEVNEAIPLDPVHAVLPAPALHALVFLSPTNIAVHNESGIWMSPRLAYDGIRNGQIVDAEFRGQGWFAPKNAWNEIRVNAAERVVHAAAYP